MLSHRATDVVEFFAVTPLYVHDDDKREAALAFQDAASIMNVNWPNPLGDRVSRGA